MDATPSPVPTRAFPVEEPVAGEPQIVDHETGQPLPVVTVATYHDPAAAEAARRVLSAGRVRCFVPDEDLVRPVSGDSRLRPIRVRVIAGEAARAAELLAERPDLISHEQAGLCCAACGSCYAAVRGPSPARRLLNRLLPDFAGHRPAACECMRCGNRWVQSDGFAVVRPARR
jgi:hypothetical protein